MGGSTFYSDAALTAESRIYLSMIALISLYSGTFLKIVQAVEKESLQVFLTGLILIGNFLLKGFGGNS